MQGTIPPSDTIKYKKKLSPSPFQPWWRTIKWKLLYQQSGHFLLLQLIKKDMDFSSTGVSMLFLVSSSNLLLDYQLFYILYTDAIL